MRIEVIPVYGLLDFVQQYLADADQQRFVPITSLRAQAQMKNPFAQEDDPGLLLAYIGDRCAGCLGLIPWRVEFGGEYRKVFWCSGAYVDPEYRDKLIAIQLIRKAMSFGIDLADIGMSEMMYRVVKAMHFRDLTPLEYMAVSPESLKLPPRWLTRLEKRWPLWKGAVSKPAARLISTWYGPLRRRWYRIAHRRYLQSETLMYREVPEFLTAHEDDKSTTPAPRFGWSVTVCNWVLQNPWVGDGGLPTQPTFPFSDVREMFRIIGLELSNSSDGGHGHAVFSISRDKGRVVIKLIDWCLSQGGPQELVSIVLKYGGRYQADRIELPLEFEPCLMRLPSHCRVVRRKKRECVYYPARKSNALQFSMSDFQLSYHDGDPPLV